MSILSDEKRMNQIFTTWEMVKKVGLQEAGLILFGKLFEINPALQELFPFRHEDISQHNETLAKHALSVMETIDTAIELIKDNEVETLVTVLVDLGLAHSMKSVTPQDFGPVGQALVHALSVAIADKFTPEVKQSWIELYAIVQVKMEEGMKEGMKLNR